MACDAATVPELTLPTAFCCDDWSNVCALADRGSKIDWKPGKFEIEDGGGTFAANCCELNVGTAAAESQTRILFLHRTKR